MGTSESLRLPACTVSVCVACVPTAPHVRHSASMTCASRTVIALRMGAMMNSARFRLIPYVVKTTTSGFRFSTLSRTLAFRPLMIETTETTVITPMMTPRSVRNDRSLCRRSAATATAKRSAKLISPGRGRRSLARALRGFLDRHAVAFLERPQRLEGAGHDLAALFEALHDFDHELAADPGFDPQELNLRILNGVDALLGLDLAGRGPLSLRRVPQHDRRERH